MILFKFATPLFLVLALSKFETVSALDFGFSGLVSNFSSGVVDAAKFPAEAISSAYERIRPGSSTDENDKNETTTVSSSLFSSTESGPTRTSTMTSSTTYDERPTGTSTEASRAKFSPMGTKPYTTTETTNTESRPTGTLTSMSQKYTNQSKILEKIVATTEDEDKEVTTESGSWVPDAIRKPFESVAEIPNKVISGAGEAWNTVSETVVNQDPEHSVKFYLHDNPRDLKSYKQIVVGQPDTLRSVSIPQGTRLNILIHGFKQDFNSSFPQNMKDTFLLHKGDYVVCVDWGHMADGKIGPEAARTLLYPFIVDNVARVGEYVGEFIVFLKENNALPSYDQVHILGFSLGAHVSGIAGWTVQHKSGQKVSRITGLDPAGPKFFLKSQERKLNKDDAEFVDVIHTSHLGYFLSLGHIDFFPNGGKIQPGCVETESTVTDAIASLGSVLSGSCSHARAWEYYTQSIKDNGLFGCECDNLFKYEITGCEAECEDKVPFGEPTPSTARGNYYLSI